MKYSGLRPKHRLCIESDDKMNMYGFFFQIQHQKKQKQMKTKICEIHERKIVAEVQTNCSEVIPYIVDTQSVSFDSCIPFTSTISIFIFSNIPIFIYYII